MGQPEAIRQLARGSRWRVLVTRRVEEEMGSWTIAQRATVDRKIRLFADGEVMAKEHIRSEGRVAIGGASYDVLAIKASKARLYAVRFDGELLIVTAATLKKAQKADRNLLRTAAERAVTIHKSIRDGSVKIVTEYE